MLVIGSGAPRLDPAPAYVGAQRSDLLAQRRPRRKDFRTPSTVGPWAKTTRRGFESREPPPQAFDTRCGAADIGRLEGAQSAYALDQAPRFLVRRTTQRSRNHQIPPRPLSGDRRDR